MNTIQVGTLDVALEKFVPGTGDDSDGEWVNVEGETLKFVNEEGVELENVLWEPGCTYKLPTLHVANNGNLALKYKVEVATISGNKELTEVLDVYLGEKRVGTLNDIYMSDDPDGIAYGDLAPKGEEGDCTEDLNISIKMQETAGNEYQGKAINGIQVTVSATQFTYESDSFDNQYDAGAFNPSSLKSLNTAINSGQENIRFDEDYTVDVNKNDGWSAIRVDKSQGAADVVTLDGTGTVTSNKFVIWARSGAKVIVNGGNYVSTGNTHLVYANEGGIVEINGGTFSGTANDYFFNVAKGHKGTIIIKGGLYSKDPRTQFNQTGSDADDSWNGTAGIKIEDGYKVVKTTIDGKDWWQVVPE